MKLIYHRGVGEVSPFDTALSAVSRGASDLRLASPYVGVGYLKNVLAAAGPWRMLTDLEAWLSSGNRMHRAQSWQFIRANLDRIRHVAGLHAKVAIGNGQLFMGSANFTTRGMAARTELSLLIDDPCAVLEAQAWFDSLWEAASSPIIEEGDALVAALDAAQWTQPKVRIKLTSTAPRIASTVGNTPRPVGFDLAGELAKIGLSESRQLLSVSDAFRRVSDVWREDNKTFTFSDLLKAVSGVANARSQDVWSLIVGETANHWLGGLDTEGFDRYIYEAGQFRSYNPFKDNPLTRHLGLVLGFVLRSIPVFPSQAQLPIEDVWYREASVPEAHVSQLVELFLDCGFLVWQDIAGEVESYSVSADFKWPFRWEKFGPEKRKFEELLAESISPDKSISRSFLALTEEGNADSPAYPVIPPPAQIDSDLAKHDAVLAALFEVLGELPIPLPVNTADVRCELERAGLPEELAQAWTELETGILRTAYILNKKRKEIPNGLQPNKSWAASYHLHHYPMALAAWRKEVLHKV